MNTNTHPQMVINHEKLISDGHAMLAKLAQSQYREVGRGFVVVKLKPETSQLAFHYVGPQQLTGQTLNDVLSYDPNQEFILSLPNPDESVRIYRLPLGRMLGFKLDSASDQLGQNGTPVARESVFNLFVYATQNIIREVGVVCHSLAGSDDEKKTFLQSHVETDFRKAKRYPLLRADFVIGESGRRSKGIQYAAFLAMVRANKHLYLFEPAFKEMKAPQTPLYCLTPVVNGVPKIDFVQHFG